jgi:predicted phosphodiesterase
MRICIISDLHANVEALRALPPDYDELWVLGDLVNYGPDPAAVIDFVRSHACVTVRGNHDHAVGFGIECGCSPRFAAMAEAMRDYTMAAVSPQDRSYLRDLPTFARRQVGRQTFFLCHATPSNPLYEYRLPDSPAWQHDEELSGKANYILVGHTHLPFHRMLGRERAVINPGSLGQSKAGDPRARYAIWDDGRVELRAFEYPVEATVKKILSLPLADEIKGDLVHVLRTGTTP